MIRTAIARLKEALKPIPGIDIVSITGLGTSWNFIAFSPNLMMEVDKINLSIIYFRTR